MGKWEYCFFDCDMVVFLFCQVEGCQVFVGYYVVGDFGDWCVDGFGYEGDSLGCLWVDFQNIDFIVFDGVLYVYQVVDFKSQSYCLCLLFQFVDYVV